MSGLHQFPRPFDFAPAIEDILFSEDTAMGKVQRIMHLGIEEETAEALVEHHQSGHAAPIYYERLDEHLY